MSAHIAIPVAIQGIALSMELFGIIANIFFLTMLVRCIRGWDAYKILLIAYHVAALVFLVFVFFPLLVVASTKRDLTSAQCSGFVPFIQASLVFQPVSLAAMALYRWKAVEAATNNGSAPNAKRYVFVLLTFVATAVAIVHISGAVVSAPFFWSGRAMVCVRVAPVWPYLFNMSFFITAPFLIFFYCKVVTAIRNYCQDGGSEFVHLIYSLTVFYYMTYLPFFVMFFLHTVTGVVVVPLIGLQIAELIHVSHSVFSPIVSIMLTKRYRGAAVGILSSRTKSAEVSDKSEASDYQRPTVSTINAANEEDVANCV